jgi:hypothetical protein
MRTNREHQTPLVKKSSYAILSRRDYQNPGFFGWYTGYTDPAVPDQRCAVNNPLHAALNRIKKHTTKTNAETNNWKFSERSFVAANRL